MTMQLWFHKKEQNVIPNSEHKFHDSYIMKKLKNIKKNIRHQHVYNTDIWYYIKFYCAQDIFDLGISKKTDVLYLWKKSKSKLYVA